MQPQIEQSRISGHYTFSLTFNIETTRINTTYIADRISLGYYNVTPFLQPVMLRQRMTVPMSRNNVYCSIICRWFTHLTPMVGTWWLFFISINELGNICINPLVGLNVIPTYIFPLSIHLHSTPVFTDECVRIGTSFWNWGWLMRVIPVIALLAIRSWKLGSCQNSAAYSLFRFYQIHNFVMIVKCYKSYDLG